MLLLSSENFIQEVHEVRKRIQCGDYLDPFHREMLILFSQQFFPTANKEERSGMPRSLSDEYQNKAGGEQ